MNKFIKKSVITIIVILVVLVVISFAGGAYLVNYALSPDLNDKSRNSDTMYNVLCERSPQAASWLDSVLVKGAIRDTVIVSKLENDHGVQLKAHYLPAVEPTDRTALLVHGFNDSFYDMLEIGYMYHHDMGFNIFIPDQYAHGESEGDAIRMGWLDRHTIMQWMDIANEVFGSNTEMVVHGVSMGAATTMMISGEDVPSYVKCFVEDCGYTSVWDEFGSELKEQFHLPKFPLLYAASEICNIKYGWRFKEASALKQVAASTLPMLFIHGDNDTFVPTWMVYPLYEAKTIGDKELYLTPGVPHARSYDTYPEEYTARVKSFVEKYLK